MLKSLIAIAVMLMPVLSFPQIQAKQNPVETTFGRYGSDCSSGRGACSFAAFKTESGIISEKTSRKTSENTFVLQINRKAITKQEEIKIAGKNFSEFAVNETPLFVQSDDLYLNPETLQNLNADIKYTRIPAGNYPMTITKDKIEVTFTLK